MRSIFLSRRAIFSSITDFEPQRKTAKYVLDVIFQMEIFRKAQVVRLRSHHDKYLTADDDQESVRQDRHGASKNARWTVEIVPDASVIRLQSCYGKYLTASDFPFLLGMTGKKVLQTLPERLDSSTEWEPINQSGQVRLKTRYGQYLRANGGLPPWRKSITHDIPHRTATHDWVLWGVDVLLTRNLEDAQNSKPSSPRFSRLESDDSYEPTFPTKFEGRLIYFKVADEEGNIDGDSEEKSFTFDGDGLEELKQKLVEETGLQDAAVCSTNPLNGSLCPLHLHLPPNNATMHVILVPSSSRGMHDSDNQC